MIKRFTKFIGRLILYFIILSIGFTLLYKYIPVYVTPLMVIRYFEDDKRTSWQHDWVSIKNISPHFQLAVICSEDQKFVNHNGFDKKAIEKAFENNKKGKTLRGASTISQQTAKNVFLWSQRSWLRKGLETYFTLLIELFWSKERILEVYLNSVELGNHVYGAQAASEYWFGINASQLNIEQASALAAILPSPRRYTANPATPYVQKQKIWIQQQMKFYGRFTLKPNKESE